MQTQETADRATQAGIGGPKQQNQSITGGVRLSIFGSATAQNPLQVKTLEEIVSDIKSEKLKTRIDHLRSLPKTAYDAAKKNLPAVVFGGEYSDRKHLIKSSGLAVVDIDDFQERGKNLRAVKAALASDPHVAVVFTSPSGDGLKVVVKIAEPGVLDADTHKTAWKGAAEIVKAISGVQYCETPTANWLCFLSADADLIYRPEAKALPPLPVVSIEPVRHVQADVSTPTRKGLPTPAEGYVRAALHRACDAVRGTLPGGRRPLLVKEAFTLGGYAELNHAEAADALVAAAAEAGLDEALSRPIIEEQLRAGALKPRQIPESGKRDAAQTEIEWIDQKPESLTVKYDRDPYPVEALPPAVREAVGEVQAFVQAPMGMVACAALGALSLAGQGIIDVRRGARLEGPSSLYLLTIAESGERKSTLDSFFRAGVESWQRDQEHALEPDRSKAATAIAIWEQKRDGLLAAIKRSVGSEKAKGSKLEADLDTHMREKPDPVVIPDLLLGEETTESLLHKLCKWPSSGVFSSEAGLIFGGHSMNPENIMRNLSSLNSLWSGETVQLGRKSVEGSHVRGARLTVSLQIQEASLRRFFEKNLELARGSGFLARFLLCWPVTTQGERKYRPAGAMPALGRFNHRIREILDQPLNWKLGRTLEPIMLSLMPEAEEMWITAHDAIEEQLRTGGCLQDVKDVASKAADNIARIAGLLQLLERGVSGIEPWAMKAAVEIVGWHLMESRRFFGELALPTELSLAARLDGWLIDRCKRGKTDSIARSDVQQFGPGCLREKKNLDIAAGELIEHRRIRYAMVEKRKYFRVHPSLIGGAS